MAPDEMRTAVEALRSEDLPREIWFAKEALDVDHPNTVYWLALLFERFEREEAST